MASVRLSFPHFLPESESAAAAVVAIGALKQKLDKSKYKRDLDGENIPEKSWKQIARGVALIAETLLKFSFPNLSGKIWEKGNYKVGSDLLSLRFLL